ncbi:hypothetical protein [Oryzifoliimicrobium ureilyticus]|uniref:hypothetical protein n=1 Tax=Oryzifoliimicrobium ureilyticus TaxID=3113724 RepID=UPI0030764ABD
MIRKIIAAGQMAMTEDDVAKCQRVFYYACAAKGIKTRSERDSLASAIIELYKDGTCVERDMLKIVV